jgi:hypothetical protein
VSVVIDATDFMFGIKEYKESYLKSAHPAFNKHKS